MIVECACYEFGQRMRRERMPELASESPGCLKRFELDINNPSIFCGGYICAPCRAELDQVLSDLKAKGVAITRKIN